MISRLKSGPVEERRKAARALVPYSSPRLFGKLRYENLALRASLNALARAYNKDRDLEVKDWALTALHIAGGFKDVDFFKRALALAEQGHFHALLDGLLPGRPGYEPRKYTMDALRLIGKTAVPGLVRFLREGKAGRVHAASALGLLGYPDAFIPLTEALRDENPDVQLSAVFALGDIGNPKAIPALEQWLRDAKTKDKWGNMVLDRHFEKVIAKIREKQL